MSTKEIKTKDLSHVDIPMLKQYATVYQNTTDTAERNRRGTGGRVPVSRIIGVSNNQ